MIYIIVNIPILMNDRDIDDDIILLNDPIHKKDHNIGHKKEVLQLSS